MVTRLVRCLIAEHVYPDNRSLGLPFMEQVAAWEVGESDKLYLVASWCTALVCHVHSFFSVRYREVRNVAVIFGVKLLAHYVNILTVNILPFVPRNNRPIANTR